MGQTNTVAIVKVPASSSGQHQLPTRAGSEKRRVATEAASSLLAAGAALESPGRSTAARLAAGGT